MNELNKKDLESINDRIEQTQKKQQEVELAFIEHLKPLKGHTLYEINNSTLEVVEADYVKTELIKWYDAVRIHENPVLKVVKDVIIKPHHSYVSALNAENAIKRHLENRGSASLPETKEMIMF